MGSRTAVGFTAGAARRLDSPRQFDTFGAVSGEATHAKGADGARRAKSWLGATTRVNAHWVNPQPVAVRKLTFYWVDRTSFSFDLGGVLIGGEYEAQEFLAVCKKYSKPQDQGTAYVDYLAKCYRASVTNPDRCDNFMWITWAPFSVGKWDRLCSADEVEEAVKLHRARAVGDGAEVDPKLCRTVAERLWLIVLSDRQESLVITPAHRALITAERVRGGSGA